MSHGFGLMIESLVAFLLLLTIGYCAMLNWRLKRMRADEQSLKATIGELITATEIAERAVNGLKRAAHECEDTLGERLKAAEHCCAELDRQVSAGDLVLTRLTRVVAAGRSLDDIPAAATAARPAAATAARPAPAKAARPAAPSAPDPQAVAAAARSFADRLRERVAALAA